jgi:hypothetical protein
MATEGPLLGPASQLRRHPASSALLVCFPPLVEGHYTLHSASGEARAQVPYPCPKGASLLGLGLLQCRCIFTTCFVSEGGAKLHYLCGEALHFLNLLGSHHLLPSPSLPLWEQLLCWLSFFFLKSGRKSDHDYDPSKKCVSHGDGCVCLNFCLMKQNFPLLHKMQSLLFCTTQHTLHYFLFCYIK